ncbi:hypothetical protein [Fannyhessea vaginae]|uniref:hypothetical protein n=1 Tax=Fannyhessea vaginae TaxID=82135 RepID=UPI0023F3F052|nr:hypothetical protein [Fannyhessea vaginae]
MKHLKRKAFVTSNVGRVAVATGLSLSMIAGNYAAIPHVALADDAPRSAFSEYAELVQKYANANLDAQDRSRLKNEIADAKKAYQESLKSPFKKYADAVQEYANTGKLAGDQLAELRNHVKETKKAWVADKNGQQNPAINNVAPAQDPADNHDGANNNGAAANNNGAAANNNGAAANNNVEPSKKSSSKHVQKVSPKTSDPFGISGLLGSVAGLVTLGAGIVARKRF